MGRKKWTGIVILCAAGIIAASIWLTRRRAKVYTASALGTGVRVVLVGRRIDAMTGRLDRLSRRALGEIEEMENLVSLFREGSDIWRLNHGGYGKNISIDERTYHLLRASLRMSAVSGGVFDICVLPLEQSWGFKTGGRRMVPAKPAKRVPRASGSVLSLEAGNGKWYAGFRTKGVRVDLGGIGKGYVVDRAISVLRDSGLYGALVDIGGDGYCMGRSARGTPWRMGLRNPRGPGVLTVLKLSDRAVATSGDYENFFVEGGKRYSHIFDPRTGRPAESGLVSATVIAPTCTEADALATTLMILGRKKGTELIERIPDTECILIGTGKKGLVVSTSSGWKL